MKYRHAHKEEYQNYFTKLAEGAFSRRKFSEPCLQCGGPTPHYHNKCCSKNCADKYRKLHPEMYKSAYNESRKLPDYTCKGCGALFRPTVKNRKFCEYECYIKYKILHPEEYIIDIEIKRRGYQKFRDNNKEAYDKWMKSCSDRMKIHNPVFDPEVKKRMMDSCKKYWDEHPEEKDARIKRFMQAPLRGKGKEWKPTKFEEKIMELNISGLNYVGDGSVFVTIGCDRDRRKKNPDFLLKGKKRVVEVGDIEFWHTLEEIKQTIVDYECIGYKCLYLTNAEMANRKIYEPMVRDFCSLN